ncbi:hypothetical protein GEMRC1_012047 [Eukaryota sp. GEM-RC1]
MAGFDVQREIIQDTLKMQQELMDLRDWEEDMQVIDKKTTQKSTTVSSSSELPPVRGTAQHEEFLKSADDTPSTTVKPSSSTSYVPSTTQESPESEAERWKKLGNAAFSKNDLLTAVERYSRAINVIATPAAYCNRSFSFLKLGDFSRSVEDATSAINLDHTSFKGYYRRACAYKRLGKFDQALADLETAKKYAVGKTIKDLNKEVDDVLRLRETKISTHDSRQSEKESIKLPTQQPEEESQSKLNVEEIASTIEAIPTQDILQPKTKPSVSHLQDTVETSVVVPNDLPAPQTVSDLEFGFREFKNHPEKLKCFLTSVDVNSLSSLFKNGLNATLYESILNILHEIDDHEFVFTFLDNLTSVQRFSFVNMFLKDKTPLIRLFDRLSSQSHAVDKLRQLYKC